LKTDYIPGDLGFDPLGLKPSDPTAFAEMQTKELQNGRLAMLAAAGFMAQELANGKGILENLLG
jgi:Chlorophyll A-B binding protein